MAHQLEIERIYGDEEYPDAYRILVDRLWPRGVSKNKAHIDEWDKSVAPSSGLRKWFGHDPDKFEEFATKYRAELDANPDAATFVAHVKEKLAEGDVVMLFGAKDETHNQAVVLRDYISAAL
jgi:uncharacterized protein YeaO (DUF488 family)